MVQCITDVVTHTKKAIRQIRHCDRSCTKLNSQHADNSSVHAQGAIFLKNEIAP